MIWRHDWLRLELAVMAWAVALVVVVYGVSRAAGWLLR